MIYLSALDLNPRSSLVRRDIADCNDLHRTVLSAFPAPVGDVKAREAFAVLYRLETARTSPIRLLVQSETEPDWSRLSSGYLCPGRSAATKRVDDHYETLFCGHELRFRLRANPTKRVGKTGKPGWVGKRVNLVTEAAQLAWLERKGRDGGFDLLTARAAPGLFGLSHPGNRSSVLEVQARTTSQIEGWRGCEGQKLSFGSVLFDGELRITDTESFRETLRRGIGSGKAYGFGLLSVAAARDPL